MNKYKVKLLRIWSKPIIVEAEHVMCPDGIYIFYNKMNQTDMDEPEAMFKKESVLKIIKMKNKGKETK